MDIHPAKTDLSSAADRALSNEEVGGKPLVTDQDPPALSSARGTLVPNDSRDAPLTDEEVEELFGQ